ALRVRRVRVRREVVVEGDVFLKNYNQVLDWSFRLLVFFVLCQYGAYGRQNQCRSGRNGGRFGDTVMHFYGVLLIQVLWRRERRRECGVRLPPLRGSPLDF